MGERQKESGRVNTLKELRHHSRRLSIKEGMFYNAKVAFGYNYISPFAIAINASSSLVALLASVFGILGPLTQAYSSKKFEYKSRKKVVTRFIFLESLVWIPFIFLAALFYFQIIPGLLPIILIVVYTIYVILNNIPAPLWFSWLGDLVDEKYRGRWFAKRSGLTQLTFIVLSVLTGIFLDFFRETRLVMLGFGVLFLLALVSRIFCYKVFKKIYEPKMKIKKIRHVSLRQLFKDTTKTNFGKFTLFRAIFGFAATISGALGSVYLLRFVGLSYFQYVLVLVATTIFSVLFINFWGKLADRYGNYKVILFSTMFLPILPLFWVLSQNPIYLILVPTFVSGVFWGGFNLAVGNFIYDNVKRDDRSTASSYSNLVMGGGVSIGGVVAALLIGFIRISVVEPIILIFFISAIVRMITVIYFIPKFREVREIKRFNNRKHLNVMILREMRTSILEEFHQIATIKRYLREK